MKIRCTMINDCTCHRTVAMEMNLKEFSLKSQQQEKFFIDTKRLELLF